jgi:uncharacterized membrane protein
MAKMAKMAKSKINKKLKAENPNYLIVTALLVGILALLQNKYGLLSDVRSFYGLHFYDGQHLWPFSEKTLLGETKVQHPVEYPALTGLIMWLISFLVSPSETAIYDYYRITAGIQIVLFAICAYLIYKLVGKKYAYYFTLAPAVLYSLNRNWDIWAILAMLFAILLFERKKYILSAFLLSVAIATKFFPIVLMLPIMIIFLRNRQISTFIKYGLTTLITWILINLPFVLVDLEGWAYFYKFSAERALGSASFYELVNIFIPGIKFSSIHFYILNILVFLLVTAFLIKLKTVPTLAESSFFVMFAFILFNKQYSMQYVIWLTSLAVITLAYISKRNRDSLIYIFIIWQVFELAFQYSYFQRILTDAYANTATPMTITVSTNVYGSVGVIRYSLAVLFTVLLARYLYKANSSIVGQSNIARV